MLPVAGVRISMGSTVYPKHLALVRQLANAITSMYATCCRPKVPSGYNKSGKVEMSLITGKHQIKWIKSNGYALLSIKN